MSNYTDTNSKIILLANLIEIISGKKCAANLIKTVCNLLPGNEYEKNSINMGTWASNHIYTAIQNIEKEIFEKIAQLSKEDISSLKTIFSNKINSTSIADWLQKIQED